MRYYVYQLIDPRNNQPFYVGKGYNRRMYSHESETRSGCWNNKEKCKIIQEIWDAGHNIKYHQEFCESDDQARIREKELILHYGRRCDSSGVLTNVHVGGNGGGRIGKPVCQYTKAGEFITEYVSASEAERQTKVQLSKITAVCRGDWKCAGGFQWKWKGDASFLNYVRENLHNRTEIFQYTMDGKYITAYRSLSEAVKAVGIGATGTGKISECCAGKLPSYKGFQWSYVKHTFVSSTLPQKKRVAQYSLNNVLIATFESITEARISTGVSGVSACCNGAYKQAGGYKWKFVSS